MNCLLLLSFLIGLSNCQVQLDEEWLGGARGHTSSPHLGNGTCYLSFPSQVYWFHCENCNIVPKKSNSIEGKYALATSDHLLQETGRFTFVVSFQKENFRQDEIALVYEDKDVNDLSVFSFPNDKDQLNKKVLSQISLDSNDNKKDRIVTIHFPENVVDFTVESSNTVFGGFRTYNISDIQASQNEIPFSFKYSPFARWFSAAEIRLTETTLTSLFNKSSDDAVENYRRAKRDSRY